MSNRVATQLASNNYRLFHIYILQWTKIGKGGPVMAAKTGLAGPILAAKVVRGPILANFSAKIGPATDRL